MKKTYDKALETTITAMLDGDFNITEDITIDDMGVLNAIFDYIKRCNMLTDDDLKDPYILMGAFIRIMGLEKEVKDAFSYEIEKEAIENYSQINGIELEEMREEISKKYHDDINEQNTYWEKTRL